MSGNNPTEGKETEQLPVVCMSCPYISIPVSPAETVQHFLQTSKFTLPVKLHRMVGRLPHCSHTFAFLLQNHRLDEGQGNQEGSK